jgi:hypothetical protein
MIVRTSRRTFVRGAASAALTLPFLRLLEGKAQAAPPKRLVVVCTPVAPVKANFIKDTGMPGSILEKFVADAALRSKMLLVRIDNTAGDRSPKPDHATDFPALLTGFHPIVSNTGAFAQGFPVAPSMDFYIGGKLNAPTRFKSLYVGTHAPSQTDLPVFSSGYMSPIPYRFNPMEVYNEALAGIAAVPGGTVNPAVERLRLERKSILDLVKIVVNAVRCQLGTDERFKLDRHLSAITDLEQSLLKVGSGTSANARCKPVAPATSYNPLTELPAIATAQINNIVAALACDATRVVGFKLGRADRDGIHHKPWIPILGDVGHHDIAHNAAPNANGTAAPSNTQRDLWMTEIEKWYAGNIYTLAKTLDSIPDLEGGTMLDNTTLVWYHEQAEGTEHIRKDHSVVILGKGAGYWKTGQYADLRGQSNAHPQGSFGGHPGQGRRLLEDGAVRRSARTVQRPAAAKLRRSDGRAVQPGHPV